MAGTRPHHTILSLEITAGFFEDVSFQFADGLNCLLGTSGTGKTLALEMIRFCLGQEPEEDTAPEQAKRFKSYIKKNLEAGGVARLQIRTKDGVKYSIERAWNEAPRFFDEKGKPLAVSLDSDLLFRADVYSQNEIIEIATDRRRQLALLDKFVDGGLLRRVALEAKKVRRQLEENAARLVALDREIVDLEESVRDLPTVSEKLKGYEGSTGADAKKLDEALRNKALREKERKTLETIREESRRARQEIEALTAGLSRRIADRIDPDIAKGPNADLFEPLAKRLTTLVEALDEARAAISKEADRTDAMLEKQAPLLEERHVEQETVFRTTLEKSKEERSRAAERTETQARFDEIAAHQRDLEARRADRETRLEERRRLLARLSELRDERFRARKEIAAKLTKSLDRMNVVVEVEQDGDTEAYREILRDALKTPGAKTNPADRLESAFRPADLARAIEKGDPDRLATRAGITPANARKVIDRLGNSERVYEIETAELEDLPRIRLRDGDALKETSELSTGQRCTAILPILLLDSDSPLVIDQPDDNIDNKFVYDIVVRSLLEARGRRQLLFATHNANIPVLGEPGRIFVLGSDATRGKIVKAGTVEEITEDVEIRVEGGKIAFLARKDRYGHR